MPWLMRALQRRLALYRLHAPYRKPAHFDYNLLVIGAGAGGLVTSYIAAAVKARVALIEQHRMGGLPPYRLRPLQGADPKRPLRY